MLVVGRDTVADEVDDDGGSLGEGPGNECDNQGDDREV